jgi:hypothetical protein
MGSFLGRLRVLPAASCAALLVPLSARVAAADLQVAPAGRFETPIDEPVEPAADATHHLRIEGTVLRPGGDGRAQHSLLVTITQ